MLYVKNNDNDMSQLKSNGEPLISIIVPVYNVEKYLRVCVDSIIQQSFREFELILVDDGSPDGCPSICDEYLANDERIKVIHKENGGLSDARNHGMLASIGKYLLFIDSDDFIGEDSLMKIMETLKNDGETDVVLLNVAYCYNDGIIKKINDPFKKDMIYKKSHKEALKYLTSLSNFTTSACLKLIKRELLIANDIFFENILWCEDTDFSMKLYLCAKTYNYCDSYIYYYRKERKGSATYSFTEKDYSDLLYIISEWIAKAKVMALSCQGSKESPDYNGFSEAIYSYFAFQYCMLISGFHKVGRTTRRKYKAETKKYSWLLKKTNDRRVSFVGIVYAILGLHLTSIALCTYEKLGSR